MTTIDWSLVQPDRKWFILRKQIKFSLWALYTSIAGIMLGYDMSVTGTATAFPDFQRQFGMPYHKGPSGYVIKAYVQSVWYAGSCIGAVTGSMITGYLVEIVGRKHTAGIGAVISAVGVTIQFIADDWEVFLGGKIINACGFSIAFYSNPIWISENTRPELRGFFLCTINGSIVLGQFLCSLVAYSTSHIRNDWSYQVLILVQYVFVAILLLGYPFFPESPFYFLRKGKIHDARKSLIKIHGSKDLLLINAEFERLKSNAEKSYLIDAEKVALISCFKNENLKRTLIALLSMASQQLIGASFVIGYVTYFMSLLEIDNYFAISVILYVVMLLSCLAAFGVVETVGRRMLLVPGMAILTLTLLVMGIMGCINSSAAIWVILVCIFLWAIVYQISIGTAGYALAGEISSPNLRPATMSLVGLCQGFSGWLIGFISPYMINPDAGDLGAKVGFVFAGIGIPLTIVFYFFIPETKGLTFNEIDHLFAQGTDCRNFQSAIKIHRDDCLAGAEVDVDPDIEEI